jgi:CubicO group peptidase (beta-lactamase class C family)
MVAGILADGRVTIAADGVHELGGDRPVADDTIFRVASITKPFVATLAMTLVQEGLLALDERPPRSRADATLRQLLGNVGGLASEWDDRPDFGDGDDALARLAEREPPLLPVRPGELFSYANSGFWLAGAACAAATGATFEDAMRVRVTEPLGLESTAFDAADRATGHEPVDPDSDEHRPVEDSYPRSRRPSGGLWSTVADLLRFARHHLGGPGPLTEESRAEMQRPASTGPGFDYGLGWFLTRCSGRLGVEHSGSAFGYQSQLVLVPDDGVALAALTNSSRGALAIDDLRVALGLARDAPETVTLDDERLGRFAGRYRGFGFELEVRPDRGGVSVVYTQLSPLGGVSRYAAAHARAIGEREFEVVEGANRGDRFDFPRDGLVRFGAIGSRVE